MHSFEILPTYPGIGQPWAFAALEMSFVADYASLGKRKTYNAK